MNTRDRQSIENDWHKVNKDMSRSFSSLESVRDFIDVVKANSELKEALRRIGNE